ncbi:MAG: hypothetical protein ABR581_06505 [Thermoleophilaceae bacterium]
MANQPLDIGRSEIAALQVVRQEFDPWPEQFAESGKALRDVRIEGGYPNTRVVVEITTPHEREPIVLSRPLWEKTHAGSPDEIARELWISVLEAY